MKRFVITAAAVLTFAASAVGAGDVLQQLGVSKGDASREVLSSFTNGNVNFYSVRDAFKKATPAVRATLVEQVLVWTKAYVNSPQFAKEYAASREQAKPVAETQPSVDDELKERRAQRQRELEEMKKNIAEMPAEYRKMAEEGYKAAVEASKQVDTEEFRQMEREGLVHERQAEAEDLAEDLERWQTEYPADPKQLVKQRLQEFLKETAGVDYAAQLVNKNGKMRFANAQYEQKPPRWKLAYRAGKDATEKARAFAQAWLGELK